MGNTKKEKVKFYNLKRIMKHEAKYYVIFGERSNGKTFAVLEYALKRYIATGEQLAIVRRWQEDIKPRRASTIFDNFINNELKGNLIEQYSNYAFDKVVYRTGKFYLAKYDVEFDKDIVQETPFAYTFSLSDMEHDKSTSYPDVTTILFDELLTRGYYLPDEFITFMNVVSTIVRYRNNVKIFMLGNTVNKYCPYFEEMGLKHVKEMKKGDIDLYEYGESDLKVVVEYADSLNKSKPSDSYFAFNNPKLNMITGGDWELNIYPHLPYKYKPKDVIFKFFVEFQDTLLQGNIIQVAGDLFLYFHYKTTPIQDVTRDYIFTLNTSPKHNVFNALLSNATPLQAKITMLFKMHKVFYQNNEIGEIISNFNKNTRNII